MNYEIKIRELEVGQILEADLEADIWTCEKNVAGKRGPQGKGIDMIFRAGDEVMGIECKGDTKNPGTDFGNLSGQAHKNVTSGKYTHNAMGVTQMYLRYIIRDLEAMKSLNLHLYLVRPDRSVIHFAPEDLDETLEEFLY